MADTILENAAGSRAGIGRLFGSCLALVGACLAATPGHAAVALNAAGDIATCGNNAGAERTAALLDRLDGPILMLGDIAYEGGSIREFRECFDSVWGRHKDRIRPVPGNHEYRSKDADGYFDYWGARAGLNRKGYYSFALGGWHIVALNSNIDAMKGSKQEKWLREDLLATDAKCILAFWHHPVFSSARHGNNAKMRDLYRSLYERGASVVLAAHDHVYERFAPQDAAAQSDPARGIRSFTVGTGGRHLYRFKKIRANSEARHSESWGALRLLLEADRYSWKFLSDTGETIDGGEADCVAR